MSEQERDSKSRIPPITKNLIFYKTLTQRNVKSRAKSDWLTDNRLTVVFPHTKSKNRENIVSKQLLVQMWRVALNSIIQVQNQRDTKTAFSQSDRR